ncbi:MATE family efflux transporter [Humibacter antri]
MSTTNTNDVAATDDTAADHTATGDTATADAGTNTTDSTRSVGGGAKRDAAAPGPATAVGSNRWYLASAPIVRALLHLCVPMAAGMVVGAVYNVINAGFIGSLHDSVLLAAITFGTPLLGLVMAVGGVFGVGGGALISRLLGASENNAGRAGEIKHVSSFALWGSVIVGVVLGTIGLLLLHPLVSLLGADAAAAPATSAYVAVFLCFVPVFAAAFCLEQLVRAEGAARQSMTGLIASTIANLVFDVLFILVLHWGVAGAALALGLSNLVSVAYYMTWLQRHSEHVSLAPRWFTLRTSVLSPVFSVGMGELVQSAFLIVTSLVLNNLAVQYGDGPLAAMGVAVRIAQVPEFLIMGITIGVLPLLAYSFGKGDGRRLSSAFRTASVAVGAVAAFFFVVVFVLRDQVFSIFSSDESLLGIGVAILTAQLVAMIGNGFTGLITSLMQATGRGTVAIVLSMAQGVLFIPIVIVANLWFGLTGIIWALTVTEAIVLLVGIVLWLSSRGAIARGLAEGSEERAGHALEQTEG